MTRFLPGIWDDPGCGSFNQDTDRLFAYHHATKHTYHSVRTSARHLDWHNQPDPFRRYEGAPYVDLPRDSDFSNARTFASIAALTEKMNLPGETRSEGCEKIALDLPWLGRLLWHSVAVSSWKRVPGRGGRYSLRVNPSSGNLHPTETYVALRGFAGMDDGLYHYRADRHGLEIRSGGAWTHCLGQALEMSRASESPLVVALTSIFWREAWKYGERAYRYCCHDLGHAMMSILLAARAGGMLGGAVAHFSDLRLSRALGLARSDEAPMMFLVFSPEKSANELSAARVDPVAGIPNELSAEEVRYELLLGIHAATVLPEPAGPRPEVSSPGPGDTVGHAKVSEPSRDALLGRVVRKRRSALDFDAGAPPMGREELAQLLDFATRDWVADWRGNFESNRAHSNRGADFVTLFVYVHRVRDCEPGVYRWDRANLRLEQLHLGDVKRVAAFLSLEQSLAGNSCFTISMIADLAEAARVFGNRAYRYVYFEAGAIGQRLYVGAEALGWNATGIGAFYDDDVHRYLGFLEEGADTVDKSLREAEKAAHVMLGSPAFPEPAQHEDLREALPVISAAKGHTAGSNQPEDPKNDAPSCRDPRKLPRQVIYHFAVGRAVPDPRLEA